MGLSGLLFTSATGARIQGTPSAMACRAVTSPSKRLRLGSRVAAKAMACGNSVFESTRIESPRSKSPETSSGTLATRCIRLRNAAIW